MALFLGERGIAEVGFPLPRSRLRVPRFAFPLLRSRVRVSRPMICSWTA